MQAKPVVVVRSYGEYLDAVSKVGPLVPVSVAARWQGVSRQAIYARVSERWLVDGMVMVPCRLDKFTGDLGSCKVSGQFANSPDNRPD